jgi:lipoprotein-releasing system permease protein
MPLVAVVAILLCSAMVLITWSVMGGFLTMFLQVGRNVEGDVSIAWPTIGFGHYEELIKRLEADPMVAAACPVIDAFGMVSLPDDRLLGVKIRGIDERYSKVSQFGEALWWKPISKPVPKDTQREDPRLSDHEFFARLAEDGRTLTKRDAKTGQVRPAVVLGIEMSGFSIRQPGQWYDPAPGILKRKAGGANPYETIDGFIINHQVTINVLPLDRGGRNIGVTSRRLPVANEFRTGVFEFDKGVVMMNLGELQRMLKMDAAQRIERPAGNPYEISDAGQTPASDAAPKVVGEDPARVTHVFVKAKPGVTPEQLRERCEGIYSDFAAQFGAEVPSPAALARARTISTWEQSYGMFIAAVKKEIAMVMGLLVLISFVAVFLVLAIFWAMVSEKTKDVGVLRSVGASRAGVAWLWLRYGMSLGIAGTILGLAASYAIIWNINPIHEWLGRAFGVSIWDPKVYYFSEIPREVEPWKAMTVLIGSVLFSIIGALIPAIRAAWFDPVKALRFE